MAESDLWKTLLKHAKEFGHLERIENMVGRGRPDVNYCIQGHEGNIELKQIDEFPARPETVVKIDHFTPQQRLWIRRRASAGGRVYVLLEVVHPVRVYMLFEGKWAALFLGTEASSKDLYRHAVVLGTGAFPISKFITEVCRRG